MSTFFAKFKDKLPKDGNSNSAGVAVNHPEEKTMALTPSTTQLLGMQAPDFELLEPLTGNFINLSSLKSDIATVILFICNHCPYVIHIQNQLVEVAKIYQFKGIAFIAINSNDVENYPADSPDNMAKIAREKQYPFPYLFDESQAIAKAYNAACTPDIYIFDKALSCVYCGQFDDSRPSNDIPVTGDSLSQALDCLLANKPIPSPQKTSIGCNIKWK